jgi:hypothetical protein
MKLVRLDGRFAFSAAHYLETSNAPIRRVQLRQMNDEAFVSTRNDTRTKSERNRSISIHRI